MHNIGYMDFIYGTKYDDVIEEIRDEANTHGDGYDSYQMDFHEEVLPFESRDEAMAWIKQHDNGWYDDHAVRYKRYAPAKKTKKIEEYERKIAELIEAKRTYEREHSVKALLATHIGCKHCGSKLYRQLLRGETCPLCHTDLRAKTTLDKLRWFDDKRAEYENRIADEEKKQKRGYEIYWLVKYEYHS